MVIHCACTNLRERGDKNSLPVSDFGIANSLEDINHRWVLGINVNGDYLYIRFTYPNRDPRYILNLIR